MVFKVLPDLGHRCTAHMNKYSIDATLVPADTVTRSHGLLKWADWCLATPAGAGAFPGESNEGEHKPAPATPKTQDQDLHDLFQWLFSVASFCHSTLSSVKTTQVSHFNKSGSSFPILSCLNSSRKSILIRLAHPFCLQQLSQIWGGGWSSALLAQNFLNSNKHIFRRDRDDQMSLKSLLILGPSLHPYSEQVYLFLDVYLCYKSQLPVGEQAGPFFSFLDSIR